MNRSELKRYRFWLVAGIGFGLILILDQLYLFGIPFGGFLGDLSEYDPTQNPLIHHWMLGVVLVVFFSYLYHKAIRE